MSEQAQRTHSAALAGYAVLVCLFFGPILFTNAILTGFDTVSIFYPHRAAAARALLEGRLPLWNPDHFLGAPLLANTQVAVFYPLNWPFLALSPGPSLAWTMALHVFLAAVFMYLFCRDAFGLRAPAAWLAGAAFAFSGFMGQQTGHLNQVSVAAWLPLVLLLGRRLWRAPSGPLLGALSLAIGLQFLAGHSQESYMILLTLAVYILFLVADRHGLRRLPPWRPLLGIALAVAGGVALAAVQLLPTLELSGLSIRSGGLSFRQASSFSLQPQDLALSLLPNYAAAAPNEMAGSIGICGLLLAVIGARYFRRRSTVYFLLALALAALLLALGRYTPVYWAAYYALPGVGLFRVPARWLFLFTFAVSALAGMGLDVLWHTLPQRRRLLALYATACGASALIVAVGSLWLRLPAPAVIALWCAVAALVAIVLATRLFQHRPSLAAAILTFVLIAELYAAGRHFEYNHYSAPETLSSMRPAIAYLTTQAQAAAAQPFRVLSVSDATWDPGDLQEIKAMLNGVPATRIADYVDAVKNKELLTANLPSLFGLQSADGYDGGVLPLRCYVDLEALFLPSDELSPDGRLRDHLSAIPATRLLSALNIAYIITDKNSDVWLDNVYYDLSFATAIADQQTMSLQQPGVATAIGLIARLEGSDEVVAGNVVAQITVADPLGGAVTAGVVAGQHTERAGTPAGLRSVDVSGDGRFYHVVIPLPSPIAASSVTIRLLPASGTLVVRGMSLIDERTSASRSVTVNSDVELVHNGDVKIYRNRRALARAYTVHHVRLLTAGQDAVAMMREPGFDAAREVVLEQPPAAPLGNNDAPDQVQIEEYAEERVVVRAHMASPGLLVLSDADYPGWQASVDGTAAPIVRANRMMRAVALSAGEHRVEFVYRPRSLVLGAALSAAALAALLALYTVAWQRR